MNVNRRGFFAVLAAAIAPIAPARWWQLRFGRTNAEPLRIGRRTKGKVMRVKFIEQTRAFSFKWE